MVKLVSRLLLVLALVPYVGPLSPSVGRCDAGQEQGCQSPECSTHCALCACSLDRQVTIAVPLLPALHTAELGFTRPQSRDPHVAPPSSEILHVPRPLA